MSNISSNRSRTSLSDAILASAHNVHAVLAGQSLSASLLATDPVLRPTVQAITFHVMRRLGLARAAKEALVERTPPNALFDAVLLVSLALLDTALEHADEMARNPQARPGVPWYAPHTLVDQAVTAVAGQQKLRPYKGLLNATLRRYIRERNAILAYTGQNPEAVWNHPPWWIAKVRRAYPDQWQALLAAANQPGPMTLRVNRRRATVEQVMAALQQAGMPAVVAGAAAITLATARPVQAIPGFSEGWWSVQDLAAQQAGSLLPVESGMRVLDACAAPGGKTAHLLERADLELLALDNDASRLERVQDNLERLGLTGPHVTLRCGDAAKPTDWWDGQLFDAVLADVPCTASGIVRRHPDIRWLRRETDIAKTAVSQRKILDALWETVKPGGHLLYATCSIFPQEGEEQAQRFTGRHNDVVRLPAPGQILPLETSDLAGSDGFFYALFAKQPGANVP